MLKRRNKDKAPQLKKEPRANLHTLIVWRERPVWLGRLCQLSGYSAHLCRGSPPLRPLARKMSTPRRVKYFYADEIGLHASLEAQRKPHTLRCDCSLCAGTPMLAGLLAPTLHSRSRCSVSFLSLSALTPALVSQACR